jgi:alpha/beta superfamily hydrolase
VENAASSWNPDAILKTIRGTDHFYWGRTTELKDVLYEFLGQVEL